MYIGFIENNYTIISLYDADTVIKCEEESETDEEFYNCIRKSNSIVSNYRIVKYVKLFNSYYDMIMCDIFISFLVKTDEICMIYPIPLPREIIYRIINDDATRVLLEYFRNIDRYKYIDKLVASEKMRRILKESIPTRLDSVFALKWFLSMLGCII